MSIPGCVKNVAEVGSSKPNGLEEKLRISPKKQRRTRREISHSLEELT